MTNYQSKNLIKKTKTGIGFIIIAALLSQLFNVAQYFYTRNTIKTETAERTLRNFQKVQHVETLKTQVETAVQNAMADVHVNIGKPNMFYSIVSHIVTQNEIILGSAIAMKPGFYPRKDRLFAPFAYNETYDGKGQAITKLLPYDYTKQEWYSRPMAADSAMWSTPYYDTGGSNLLIQTYSQPIHNHEGKAIGVVTADVYFENMVVQDDEIYGSIDKVNLVGFGLQLMALLLIAYIIARYFGKMRQINKLITVEKVLKNEIQIAGDIQQAMLAKISDDDDSLHHVEVKECLIPAPDVGADFYDYLYIGGKMVFCIGDVPGSNVAAAIMMSVARSVFRTAATVLGKDKQSVVPADIVASMNHTLCSVNHHQMFATLLVGLLDVENGRLTYCNAGNPCPFVLGSHQAKMLEAEPNIPIGIVDDYKYVEQSISIGDDFTLFLYNDGLYETENAYHSPYGMKRLATRLTNSVEAGDNPEKILSKLRLSIEAHRGSTPQTDDVLMLAIKIKK